MPRPASRSLSIYVCSLDLEQDGTTLKIQIRAHEILHGEAEVIGSPVKLGLDAQVEEGVVKGAAHQKLEREIIGTLGPLHGLVDLGLVPCLHEPVPAGEGRGLVYGQGVCVEGGPGK